MQGLGELAWLLARYGLNMNRKGLVGNNLSGSVRKMGRDNCINDVEEPYSEVQSSEVF